MSVPRSFRAALLTLLFLPGLLLATAAPASAGTTPAAAATTCGPLPLERSRFPSGPEIDNRFLPLVPGMQFQLDGTVTGDDGQAHPHRISMTVTDLTKVVDGVRSMVVFDVDLQDGVVQESELFFVAQRSDGSVWTLGEYPEEYQDGRLTGAPKTWVAGVQGARAGKAMLAHPRLGTPTYLQGLSPKIAFQDCATVFATGQHVCVTVGCFDDVLVVDEFAPNDPRGGHQRKFYAPGVGNVMVAAPDGVDPEALQLTKAAKLCPDAFEGVRDQVLAQDARGYTVAGAIIGHTTHARRTLRAETC